MDSFLQLLTSAKKRDVEALSALYQHFLPGIFGYIMARVGNRAVAEDLTSEVFVRMLLNMQQIQATSEPVFLCWLIRVSRSVISDCYLDPPCIPLDCIDDIECVVDAAQEKQKSLSEIFSQLTEEQRVVLTGSIMMNYDAQKIGDIIGKSADAVRSLQYRALKRLKQLLGQRKDCHATVS